MEKLSRRSFVKRTGAVTLGSVLGLGILPSVTRKLYAADTSQTIASGVSMSWEKPTKVQTTPSTDGGKFLPGRPYPNYMVTSISLSSSVGKDQCNLIAKMTIVQKASYVEKRPNGPYQVDFIENSWYQYACCNGVVMVQGYFDEYSGTQGTGNTTLMDENGRPMGTLVPGNSNPDHMHPTMAPFIVTADGTQVSAPSITIPYSVVCCAFM